MNQKAWWRTVPTATLYHLLRRPLVRWVLSYAYMHHFAAGMTNHEEDIEGLEENGLHTDEVASPDFGGMPMEKAPPSG